MPPCARCAARVAACRQRKCYNPCNACARRTLWLSITVAVLAFTGSEVAIWSIGNFPAASASQACPTIDMTTVPNAVLNFKLYQCEFPPRSPCCFHCLMIVVCFSCLPVHVHVPSSGLF